MKTRSRTWTWVDCVVAVLLLLGVAGVAVAGEPRATQVSYNAADQEASSMIAALSSLSGETYQPDVELLAAGINGTRATFSLVAAGPNSCRQAVAFALDCWWAVDADGYIVLLQSDRLPRGPVDVRTRSSTLQRQPQLHVMCERLLAPWLGGQAGLSYLPSEGLWSATLDSEGHRRLIELLSLCERPNAQAASRVADPTTPDLRQMIANDISANAWPTLVEQLAASLNAPVALSPRLRLRSFPSDGVRLSRQTVAQAVDSLRAQGIAAQWCKGVLCLAEPSLSKEHVDREHPAQRRRLAAIPIGHLVSGPLDGELVVATLRRQIATAWWTLPGAGIEFLADSGTLLVAADVDTQHAVLDAVTALDTVGLELGLQTLTGGAR